MTHGVIGPGETVTWRGRHFGFMLTHQSLISEYEPPHHFQDRMLRGMFKSFIHDHYCEAASQSHTLMRDEPRFAAPLGPLGWIAETLVLRRYFIRFLRQRNETLRAIAEAPSAVWEKYLALEHYRKLTSPGVDAGTTTGLLNSPTKITAIIAPATISSTNFA